MKLRAQTAALVTKEPRVDLPLRSLNFGKWASTSASIVVHVERRGDYYSCTKQKDCCLPVGEGCDYEHAVVIRRP
jgi:hypothetical protein